MRYCRPLLRYCRLAGVQGSLSLASAPLSTAIHPSRARWLAKRGYLCPETKGMHLCKKVAARSIQVKHVRPIIQGVVSV